MKLTHPLKPTWFIDMYSIHDWFYQNVDYIKESTPKLALGFSNEDSFYYFIIAGLFTIPDFKIIRTGLFDGYPTTWFTGSAAFTLRGLFITKYLLSHPNGVEKFREYMTTKLSHFEKEHNKPYEQIFYFKIT